jgi:membrane fusion protein (multidrug efflux system)
MNPKLSSTTISADSAAPTAPASAVPQSPRRSGRVAAIITGALLVTAGLAWLGWSSRATESTDSAFVDGHRVVMAAQASGRVSDVLVDDNQHVTAGQVLLRIDPADYAVKLEQAQAARAQAEGALAHARAQLPVIESGARQAAAQVKIAAANARRTADDLHRYQGLSENAVSKLVLDAASTQVDVGEAQLDAARQAAAGAVAQIALARTAITTAEASVAAAAAQVAQARLNLSYCEIKAPVAGYVTRKTVEAGNIIQSGQPLLNLVTDDRFVTANFKETQLTHLLSGQPATITVDTFPGLTFKGRVESRMAGTGSAFALLPPENATGNFVKVVQRIPVKIVFDHADNARLPGSALGMSVIATVDVSAPPTAATNSVTVNR